METITTTKTFNAGGRHVGYVVENEHGAVVATVTPSRRAGYIVRRYITPDDHDNTWVINLIDARDLAQEWARRMS